MKFTNGYWLIKDGYKIVNPKMVYDFDIKDKKITVYAPGVYVENKGCTLDGGLLTVEFSSPILDVMRVRVYHHKGAADKGPHFEINDKKLNIASNIDDKKLSFSSGSLKVELNKKNWAIKFFNGNKFITSSVSNGMGYVIKDHKQKFMKDELTLDVGELVYGLGERFTPFIKNGQTVDIWNEDGGTGSDQTYKNIPFYISNKGYGILVNHPEKVSFEIASEKVSRVQFSVEGEYIEYFIMCGNSLKDVLKNYTMLTGKPSLPPAWSFGLWLSTSFLTNYDEETVTSFIDGMRERDIPLDVFHFDCLWMKEFEWCNFKWDERMFKNPEKMLKNIKSKGLRVCVWINPYIAQKSPLFDMGMENGYFIKRENGDIWQWDMWQAGMAIVDFTNPKAVKWYQGYLEKLIDMGVDAFKTDFGERIPTDVVYYDGSDPKKMHNYYTYLYNKAVYEVIEKKLGKENAVVFARSASVGGQKFPVHWGGDCTSTYPSMAESLRGGLSFTLSGFGFWSHDIGGFENGCTPDLYKRWTQFGLLSTHSRYHGSGQYKVPWLYDEEATDVTRKFTKLKCSLMPYLYRNACETAATGVPMMRAMVLEFPNDETCNYLDRQYMLGDNLLVAPIFNNKGDVKYYLPEGKWTNMLTNEVYDGEKWYNENFDYMTLPLLARENSIIVFGNSDNKAEYNYEEGPAINIFELLEGEASQTVIYDNKGNKAASVTALKEGNKISIETSGIAGEYKVILRNVYDVKKVSQGEVSKVNEGTLIKLKENELTVGLF